MSHVLGEIAWLMSQSTRHKAFSIVDLSWFAMPAIVARQFHIFREGERPVGVALWAFPSADAEARLASALISPENRLEPGEWSAGGALWLVDLVAPFASVENQHFELMLGDLVAGPLKGREFRMLRIEHGTGEASATIVPADAGTQLSSKIAEAASLRNAR